MKPKTSRMIERFCELVSIDSPSYGERQMGDHIKKQLDLLGMAVFEDDAGAKLNGNCGNIYAYLDGNIDAPPLLFGAHMDTVEPSKGKRAVISNDGTIKSTCETVLGADDAAGIAAILEALTVIKEQKLPHRPIEVLFTVAEEVYCRGIALFDFSMLRSKEAYIFDLTGPVGTAAYQAPTILQFIITVHGKASHAGFAPEEGINAILVATACISLLPSGRIGDDTTLNIGGIEGGLATNIVPDKCTVKGEIRSFSHEKALNQLAFVKEQFESTCADRGASISFDTFTASIAYETPPEHPVVKRFEAACEEKGFHASLIKTFGGSDNNILADKGITGIVLATAMNNCHSCNEYTSIAELDRIAELAVKLMTM